ncbi:MAG: cation transporter [Deltaproteobacteria bacterium]|nr:cation transporter [Deltaproteobacteria bacterium]
MNPFKKALILSYFTVGYNILEGVASIVAGLLTGSIALIGFGFDSAIESFSGAVLVWWLTIHGRIPEEEEERAEKRAVKLVGISFFVLAAYVFFESAKKLYFHEHTEPSLFGIVIAILSIIVMPALSYAKLRTAKRIGSAALKADSRQTFLCSLLSVALLLGLGLNYFFGLWWADPVGAFVMLFFIIREGIEALKEEKCCGC